MNANWELGTFEKYENNPILTPTGDSWRSKDVFNPAAWTDGARVWLLYRAEDSTGIGDWNGTSRIGLAHSTDGFNFVSEAQPILEPGETWELPGGCEDPRLVQIQGAYYLTYTAFDGVTARLALASSKDLFVWQKHGLLFPERGWTKSGAILTTPLDGLYWMYFGDADIWAAHSENLLDWTVVDKPVLQPRPKRFDSLLVEPGPPPLLTEQGILLLYNGADDNSVYTCGQVLLDKQDPTRVIARSEHPFFTPSVELEFAGQVPNVVFIEGLVQFKGRWFLFYGMGDSGIGVATCDMRLNRGGV